MEIIGYKDTDIIKQYYFPKIVLEEKILPGARVLDIGCGPGYFLQECDNYGLKTYGVDKDCKILEEAARRTKARLYCHDVNYGLPMFEDNLFDLVVMLDVIEHLKCPFIVLKEVYRILRHNGKLVLTTPNLNSIARFILKKNFHGYKDETHIYLFTPTSLEFLVKRVGFKVIKINTPVALFKRYSKNPLFRVVSEFVATLGVGGEIYLVGVKV